MQLSQEHRGALLDIARRAIRNVVFAADGAPPPDPAIDVLAQPAGCFVSLHEFSGRLRGCTGQLHAEDPLWLAAHQCAVDVLEDPRFTNDPVTASDLPNLELEITVLSALHPADNPLDFEPLEEGIYLTIDKCGGCFLPQVARDTGWSREQLLERLCSEKLGLAADAWQSSEARLQTFTSLILGPEPIGVSVAPIEDKSARLPL